MTFGLPWNELHPALPQSPESETLLAEVRAAAEDLVGGLRRAEKLTQRWADPGLTDALVDAALSKCLARLARTGCWGAANQLPSSELWRIAGPLLEVGTLQYHARFKPHGYAGDHEMLVRICEQSSCNDLLGGAFDRYFLAQAAPQAVLARTRQTTAALVSHCVARDSAEYQVLSVGSGPAIDVSEALALLPQGHRADISVTLLDLDPAALESARRRVEPLLPSGALRCCRENLFRLAQAADPEAILGTPDFLVCPGLFDYLDDEAAASLLNVFWERLGESGLLLVGNFAPHNPTRAYMEWIGNWYLTYRTAEQLSRLAVQAAIPRDRFTIGCERLGVNLFLIGKRDHSPA